MPRRLLGAGNSGDERGKRKEERGKRKEERGKRKEERGKRKEFSQLLHVSVLIPMISDEYVKNTISPNRFRKSRRRVIAMKLNIMQ